MGWNTSAIFVADRSTDQLLALLPDGVDHRPTGQRVGLDEAGAASPGDRCYVATDGGWAQMWDPELRVVADGPGLTEGAGAALLAGTRTLFVIFSSVSSTYGFWYYEDCELVREIFYQDGEPVSEVGDPLPVESTVTFPSWGPDEDFIFAVIEAVTGRTPGAELRYDVHELS